MATVTVCVLFLITLWVVVSDVRKNREKRVEASKAFAEKDARLEGVNRGEEVIREKIDFVLYPEVAELERKIETQMIEIRGLLKAKGMMQEAGDYSDNGKEHERIAEDTRFSRTGSVPTEP